MPGQITALSNALATLGRGTTLAELLKLIHFPGYSFRASNSWSTVPVT